MSTQDSDPADERKRLPLRRQPTTVEALRHAVFEWTGVKHVENKIGGIVITTSKDFKRDWEPIIGPVDID